MGNLIDDFEETDANLGVSHPSATPNSTLSSLPPVTRRMIMMMQAYWETVLGTLLWESDNTHPLEMYRGARPNY